MAKFSPSNPKSSILVILATVIFLLLITLLYAPSQVFDGTDTKDYTDTAKFFAGEYQAKQRASHSVLYGLIYSPFVKLTKSFIFLKLGSVFWLSLLIISMYYLSKKNRKTLLLFITTPILWYMAPWISPLPLVSLLFLWAYHFIKKFELKENLKYLIYSGLLMGLASAFWWTALYISFVFMICFLYNKKLYSSFLFLFSVILGALPSLVLDQILFNFAFYSLLKHFFSCVAFSLYGGIYSQGWSPTSKIIVLLFVPFYSYLFYKKNNFMDNKKSIIFLTISIIFVLINSQIRLVLPFVPIILLLLGKILTEKQFRIQILIFLVLGLLVVNPYVIQMKYETNGTEFNSFIHEFPNLTFNSVFTESLISNDLKEIAKSYPNQTFVVGNHNDNYRELAHIYWGEDIKEFVSIEDYNLFLNNESTIISKKLSSKATIPERREIWIEIGLGKSSNDKTDYNSINYAISFSENISLPNFKLAKKFRVLYLFEREK